MTVNAEIQAPDTQKQPEKSPEKSFAALRQQLEGERAEKESMRRRLEALEKQVQRPGSQSVQEDEESDEPYVDPRTLKKKMQKFEQSMEEKIDKRAEEKAREIINQDKRETYFKNNPDFQDVMTQDMIQKFADKHPAMAQAILRMPDGFEKQQLVYENIKALGINRKEEPNIQKTIDQNKRNAFYIPNAQGTPGYQMQGDFSAAGQKSAYDKLQQVKSRLRQG